MEPAVELKPHEEGRSLLKFPVFESSSVFKYNSGCLQDPEQTFVCFYLTLSLFPAHFSQEMVPGTG